MDIPSKPGEDPQKAYTEWRRTEAGKDAWRHGREINFKRNADGSFRVDDVPAGKYLLRLAGGFPEGGYGSIAVRSFEMPPIPSGESNEPLDLGTITAKWPPEKKPGANAAPSPQTQPAATRPAASSGAATLPAAGQITGRKRSDARRSTRPPGLTPGVNPKPEQASVRK
jgi:hypothetical protein